MLFILGSLEFEIEEGSGVTLAICYATCRAD